MQTAPSPIGTALRILTFRASKDELTALNHRHLFLGLIMTWLVGMGRWWEDPRANLFQQLGVGSVIYIFVLALFLWLIFWPLTLKRWSYFNILTFISLTAPPGILYAIPVRHGLELHTAQTVRLWLLAIVAGWRVLLLGYYLRRGIGFSAFKLVVGTLFPLILLVVILTQLNLEKVVFDFMGGIRQQDRSVNDAAYSTLFLITVISFYLFLPLFLCYVGMSIRNLASKYGHRRKNQTEECGQRKHTAQE